jgi:hypothetical protein
MVELSFTALRAREVLKWRFVPRCCSVDDDEEMVVIVGRVWERVLKERWEAICSALRREMSYYQKRKKCQ